MPAIKNPDDFRRYLTGFCSRDGSQDIAAYDKAADASGRADGAYGAEGTDFSGDCRRTEVTVSSDTGVRYFTNSFWTAKQRQASSIHEISYRACFKPQLPHFFIDLLTDEGDTVYDPFTGRGTTVIEAALMNRRIISNDINPLSRILSKPRLFVPQPDEIAERLADIFKNAERHLKKSDFTPELPMFYHPATEYEIAVLTNYLKTREDSGNSDRIDDWIRMTATNRLTGHSKGFFSVYTLPPNQAVSIESQIKINEKRSQIPEYRDVAALILKKSRNLIKSLTAADMENLKTAGSTARFLTRDACDTHEIAPSSVTLTVTSPPFLNIVQYSADNWLRCRFNSLDAREIGEKITMSSSLAEWCGTMQAVFDELYRITVSGGWVAFEVGEVRKGEVRLDESVIPLGHKSGFECAGVLINEQDFTKTSQIWGISNKKRGTNTNRIVVFYKK